MWLAAMVRFDDNEYDVSVKYDERRGNVHVHRIVGVSTESMAACDVIE